MTLAAAPAIRLSARRRGIDAWGERQRNLLGWSLILILCCVIAGVLIVGRGGVLSLLFPVLGVAVGAFLLVACPNLFLGFAWWLWFLTPELRRMADFQGGWNAVNPLMLTPLLVSGLTVFSIARRAYDLTLKGMVGFVAIMISLVYGTLVGVVTTSPTVAAYSLVVWAVPVLLGIHLAMQPERYPANRRTLSSVFGWGACVMGIYGIIQYFLAPPWDTFWMISSDQMVQGKPFPMQIRVFSTMNSSGPFAFILAAGLLLLLAGQDRLGLPKAAFGFASLLLSLVRAAWIGWILGYVYLLACMPLRRRLRMIVVSGFAAMALSTLFLTGPVQDAIAKRFDTFTELQDDDSFQLRRQFYLEFMTRALTNVVGEGIGSTSYVTRAANFGEISSGFYGDSGFMQIPFVLGWFGTLFYTCGLVALMRYGFRRTVPASDIFYSVSKAIVVMVLAEMLFENTLINVMGACFFTFLGMCLAGQRYYAGMRMVPPADVGNGGRSFRASNGA